MRTLGRIGLFVLTNFLIFATISIVLNILGVGHYISASGLDYQALFVFCLVWGMVGSLISLQFSRWMAKSFHGVKVINPDSPGSYAGLVQMVHHLSQQAGLPKMPEVGIYESPTVNAFATGPSKRRSLVAFSTGILQHMNRDELEGVAAHEIAHIQNGDMVTMTLLQGVVNAFVMFFSRIISFVISERVNEDYRYMTRMLVTMFLEIIIGMLGVLLVAWFSRHREFKADAGSAKLAGREKMIAALESLKRLQTVGAQFAQHEPASMSAFKISSGKKGRAIWSTHPPLEDRIEALKTFKN